MKKENQQSDIESLRLKLREAKKKNKSLADKLKRSKDKCSSQNQELLKKEPRIIELKKEQLESLSNRLPDIDIQNLLLD